MPGVTITVLGTSRGVITDNDGSFQIDARSSDKLSFSFIGKQSQIVEVGNQITIHVRMEEEMIGIEEVVAIGYGSQKKVNLTGAVGVANSERLENRTITSVGRGFRV